MPVGAKKLNVSAIVTDKPISTFNEVNAVFVAVRVSVYQMKQLNYP